MTARLKLKRQIHDRAQAESDFVRRQDLHADISVWSAQQYRLAVNEAEALAEAAEGTPGFRRRNQLLADIFHYEQHFDRPDYNRAQPAKGGKG
ncbi:MAG TPA: hypothetical protein VGG27_17785 [Magnetospirillaceae bacterium]|jgi:hypothetical protein